jgi:hypothetical protein
MSKTKNSQPVPFMNPEASDTYPNVPTDEPGLVGGPSTESVPGSHREHATWKAAEGVTDDGGETTLSGRPREAGGDRTSKP